MAVSEQSSVVILPAVRVTATVVAPLVQSWPVRLPSLAVRATVVPPVVTAARPGVVRALTFDSYGRPVGWAAGQTQATDYGDGTIALAKLTSSVQSSISAASGSGCRVKRTADFTVADSTWTALTFDAESYDPDGFHSTSSNTSRLTVPSGKAGKYVILGQVQWENPGVVIATYTLRVRLNATTVIAVSWPQNAPASQPSQQVHAVYDLAVGDYVELEAYQTTGGDHEILNASDYSPVFSLQLVA